MKTERDGANEVKQGYFEIWIGADYPAFFAPPDPNRRREEYFELHAHSGADVKRVNAAYRVAAMIFPMSRFTERGRLCPHESQLRNARTRLSALLPAGSRPRCASQFGFKNFS